MTKLCIKTFRRPWKRVSYGPHTFLITLQCSLWQRRMEPFNLSWLCALNAVTVNNFIPCRSLKIFLIHLLVPKYSVILTSSPGIIKFVLLQVTNRDIIIYFLPIFWVLRQNFGMTNALLSFVTLLNKNFKELFRKWVVNYLDYVIFFSKK